MIKLAPLSDKPVSKPEDFMSNDTLGSTHFTERNSFVPTDDQLSNILISRVLAYCLDLMIMVGLALGVGIIIAMTNIFGAIFGAISLGILPLLGIPVFGIVAVLYDMITVGGRSSATFGQRIFEVEIQAYDGGRPSYFQAMIQSLLFYFGWSITGPFFLVVSLFNDSRRSLHDMLSGTVVVRR